jgi:hypothetical protein
MKFSIEASSSDDEKEKTNSGRKSGNEISSKQVDNNRKNKNNNINTNSRSEIEKNKKIALGGIFGAQNSSKTVKTTKNSGTGNNGYSQIEVQSDDSEVLSDFNASRSTSSRGESDRGGGGGGRKGGSGGQRGSARGSGREEEDDGEGAVNPFRRER